MTQTSQAGLPLYTSMARLTPTELSCAPGFDPFIEPLRTDLQKRWAEKPSFPKVRDRRLVSAAVEGYLDRKSKSRSSSEPELKDPDLKVPEIKASGNDLV